MNIDVWTIERDPRADLAALVSCLSPGEMVRAERLKIAERRDAFVYNRAMVRHVLASYAGIEPHEVPLSTSPQGKPLWANPVDSVQLAFNLSHRRDLAILAVSRGRCVGVDLEVLEEGANYDALAAQTLSAGELAIYQQLPPDDQPAAILRAWTRKEAYLKALGQGLARPLCEIQVTFSLHEPPQLLTSGDPDDAPADWILRSWSPRAGWFAALATPREGGSLQLQSKSAASLRDRCASPQAPGIGRSERCRI